MAAEDTRKLVIGSAGKNHPDAVTLDIDPAHQPDVVHDLRVIPYPFSDDRFDEITCHHVLEHLDDLSVVMGELHRICHPQGSIYIEVPHYTSRFANSPEHKLRFNWGAFDTFVADVRTWRTGRKYTLLKREITFHRAFRRYFLHRVFNRFPAAYEQFWCYLFPAEHLKVWLRPIKK